MRRYNVGMTPARTAPRTNPAPVAEGTSPNVLHRILSPGIAIALWHRPSPWPEGLALPDLSLLLETGPEEAEAVIAAAAGAAFPPAVTADAAGLARRLAAIIGARRLRIRLERVTGDACTRFHADHLTLRLLVTYAGPGTEWRTVPDGPVRRVPAGSVAVLKGLRLMAEPQILHRSPPIAARGLRRLFLAVDPLP